MEAERHKLTNMIDAVFGDSHGKTRQKIGWLYALLITFNVGAWVWALLAFRHYQLLMGTSLLAWSFGLRHAVDADHIAAIDNVTRKLVQDGQRPVSVGLMFSLGHSTIVVFASICVAAASMALRSHIDEAKEVGGFIGALVSMSFLFAIALMNLLVLKAVIAAFRRVRRGEAYLEEDFDLLLASRGFLSRIFRPLFRLITRSWQMYFLGFLFGLGFDTATEVALLGISATSTAQGLPILAILVFPTLFTASMALIDTTDSILMLGAYGWAFVKPIRKIYYNITITSISIVVALVVGSIEGLGMLAGKMRFSGRFWEAVATMNDNFGLIGYVIVGVFVVSWLCSIAIYRWKRLDEVDVGSNVH